MVVAVVPEDDVMAGLPAEVWQWAWGRSPSKYSAGTNVRTREAIRRLVTSVGFGQAVVVEWDAVLWRWPEGGFARDGLTASVFESADASFEGRRYLHSPIVIGSREVGARWVAGMDAIPDGAERGFGDRYLGLAAERAPGGPLRLYDAHEKGWAWSANHIDASRLPEALAAIRAGGRDRPVLFQHGIKDREAFLALRNEVDRAGGRV